MGECGKNNVDNRALKKEVFCLRAGLCSASHRCGLLRAEVRDAPGDTRALAVIQFPPRRRDPATDTLYIPFTCSLFKGLLMGTVASTSHNR